MKKTVVHTWTQRVSNLSSDNHTNTWGLGDLIRGAIALKEVCDELDINFSIDLSAPPISKFFEPRSKDCPRISDIKNIRFEIFDTRVAIVNFILSETKKSDFVYLNTNGGPVWPERISQETKDYLKKILTPSAEIVNYLNALTISQSRYGIVHFRLGDEELLNKSNFIFPEQILLLKIYSDCNDILLTDSISFRQMAISKCNIQCTNGNPAHTGITGDHDLLFSTVAEFFLAARSSVIKTYSVYPWTSGFMRSVSLLYDVPLISINNQNIAKLVRRYFKTKVFLTKFFSWALHS